MSPLLYRHLQQGSAHLGWLTNILADGRRFIFGDAVSAADLAAYSVFWLLKERSYIEWVKKRDCRDYRYPKHDYFQERQIRTVQAEEDWRPRRI